MFAVRLLRGPYYQHKYAYVCFNERLVHFVFFVLKPTSFPYLLLMHAPGGKFIYGCYTSTEPTKEFRPAFVPCYTPKRGHGGMRACVCTGGCLHIAVHPRTANRVRYYYHRGVHVFNNQQSRRFRNWINSYHYFI